MLLWMMLMATQVQGHRGARAVRPENTLPAFLYAAELGVDVLEMDLAVTADGHIVVSHDPYIDAALCLDGEGRRIEHGPAIQSLTLAEVKRYDCGSLPNARFPRQQAHPRTPIPTLDEVFTWAAGHPQGRSVRFNLEVKLVPGRPTLTPTPAAFAEALARLIRAHKLEARVVVQCFDQALLLEMAAQAPSITRALLTAENRLDYVAAAKAAKAQIVSPHHLWITAADVAQMHAAGLKVIPWTLNAEEDWRRALDLGVDGIISDDPARLMAFLKAQPGEAKEIP